MSRRSKIEFAILLTLVFLTFLLAGLGCGGPPPAPSSWVSVGTAPAGVDTAVEVVREHYPQLPAGGTIFWATAPFGCTTDALIYSGCTYPTDPIEVSVLFEPEIEHTALAYEFVVGVLHLAPDHSPEADVLASILDDAIACRLGRCR
jgi:hypothetical protein